MALPVAQLRGMLEERGVSCSGCLEKSDVARRVLETSATTW